MNQDVPPGCSSLSKGRKKFVLKIKRHKWKT